MRIKTVKVGPAIPELVERFKIAMTDVRRYVIGREPELSALMICLLSKQHLLLHGKHGIAKSRFALLAFKAFTDAKLFSTLMTGDMTPDHIFGLPNTKKLREDGTMELNTSGKLPEADFAYLDELFNASGVVLDSTLNILNERHFFNGRIQIKTPLKTAIATTNKISEGDEYAPFLDRFLITLDCKPADSDSARRSILTAFDEYQDVETVKLAETLSLKELLLIQASVNQVKLPESFISFLLEIREQYIRTHNTYISDRRLCWTYQALKSAVLLESDGQHVSNPKFDTLAVVADTLARNPSHIAAIQQTIANQHASIARAEREADEILQVEAAADKLLKRYDDAMPTERKQKMLERVSQTIVQMSAVAPESQFTTTSYIERYRKVLKDFDDLKLQLEADVAASV